MVFVLVASPSFPSPINMSNLRIRQLTITRSTSNRNNNMSSFKSSNFYHPSVDPDRVFAGNFAPVNELPPTKCLVVHGSLPANLNGVYIRNGPNPQHRPLGPLHFFEGDGMLHSLKISNGHATFCSRYVQTYKFTLERRAGVPIFPNIFSGFHCAGDIFRSFLAAWRVVVGHINPMRGFGVANTSLACISNKLLALGESDLPYALALTPDGDITTLGRWDFSGELFANMTAHPKFEAATGETFAFRCSPFFPFLTFFRFDKNGVKHKNVPISSVKQPTLIHDFAVTERYAIFPESQLVVEATNLIFGQGMPVVHDPDKIPRIGVMPRYATNDADMKWFQVPGFNTMHIINAWEDGDDAIVMVASNIISIGHILKEMGKVHFSLEKIRINPKTGKISRKMLSKRNLEAGSINGLFAGKKNRYAYLGVFEQVPKALGLVKIDLEMECEVSKRLYGENCYGGEVMFVSRDEDDPTLDEDDGYVVTYVHDENVGVSKFLVMDAKSPELDIVAVVNLPGRVPYGFHGIFLSDKKLQHFVL